MAEKRRVVKMGTIIARRVFTVAETRRRHVVVAFGMPRAVPGWDWACPVSVKGLLGLRSTPRPVFGIDALQALELALQDARATLWRHAPRLSWLDDRRNLGLAGSIPSYLPRKYRPSSNRRCDGRALSSGEMSARSVRQSARQRRPLAAHRRLMPVVVRIATGNDPDVEWAREQPRSPTVCLMLYLATQGDLPPRTSPELSVEEVEPSREAVRQWFSLPIVRFIGAHSGCSCGFPHVVAEEPIDTGRDVRRPGPGGRFDECRFSAGPRSRTRESDRGSAVVSGLDGEEGSPPKGEINVGLGALNRERFFFNEQFFYRVRAAAE